MDKVAYIRREIIVSATISILLSAVFHLAVFGWGRAAPVWGIGAFAFDAVVQAFAVGLMAAIVPGLLCRKSMLAGKIAGAIRTESRVGTVVGRAFMSAIATAVLGGGLFALLLWLFADDTIAFAPAFSAKVVFGAMLGVVVTRRFLMKMLG